MQAQDIMTRPVVTVGPETTVRDIARLLVERRISAVPVVDAQGRLVGMVSEGDLMRRPESETEPHPSWWLWQLASPEEHSREYVKTHGLHAKDVMTPNVLTVSEDTMVEEIATLLEKHQIKRVPVMSDGRLVGIVSRANLLHGLVARRKGVTPSPDEREIRAALLDGLEHAGIRTTFINIVVSGDTMYVWGVVESAAEKDALRVAVERMPAIRHVEDHVSVLPPNVRATLWI